MAADAIFHSAAAAAAKSSAVVAGDGDGSRGSPRLSHAAAAGDRDGSVEESQVFSAVLRAGKGRYAPIVGLQASRQQRVYSARPLGVGSQSCASTAAAVDAEAAAAAPRTRLARWASSSSSRCSDHPPATAEAYWQSHMQVHAEGEMPLRQHMPILA